MHRHVTFVHSARTIADAIKRERYESWQRNYAAFQYLSAHPLRPVFLVPGANLCSAALDLGRMVVRRAERHVVALQQVDQCESPEVLRYLNRTSDLLYVLPRWAAAEADEPVSHETDAGD